MKLIEIIKSNITSLSVDAIVNAANEGLWAGSGVCGAIFKAAGYDELQAACNSIGHCDVGSAVITPGFKAKAKYIIHAVGPRYLDGKHGEADLLYHAYHRSLELAVENHCRSIGLPLISAGIFGYPLEGAWNEAIRACGDFLDNHPDADLKIIFAVLDDHFLEIGRKILAHSSASAYKIAEKSDWKTLDMPAENDTFILFRSFDSDQMNALRKGNIPQEMEDKWFWYMEDNTLYAHRSWTGYCIYRIDFKGNNQHVVTVNRNIDQYNCSNVKEDEKQLNMLLDWWTKAPYDHYNEWLAETVETFKKSGHIKDVLKVGDEEHLAVFFHKPEEENGYLCNWYISPFDTDGKHFSSVEQYIMYRKCMLFGDRKSAEEVLSTDDPAVQQALGRKATGYVHNVWQGKRQMVLFKGLMAKFSQNQELLEKLLGTGDSWLVECAGSDKIWACGIRLDDEKRHDTTNWTGTNILGFTLMEVRTILQVTHLEDN